MRKVIVKQDPEKEVPVEIMAAEIVAMARGIRVLRKGRLNDNALFLLIQHAAPNAGGRRGYTPIPLKIIKAVFAGIDALESTWLKKVPK